MTVQPSADTVSPGVLYHVLRGKVPLLNDQGIHLSSEATNLQILEESDIPQTLKFDMKRLPTGAVCVVVDKCKYLFAMPELLERGMADNLFALSTSWFYQISNVVRYIQQTLGSL